MHEERHWQHCMAGNMTLRLAPPLTAWQALALLAALAAPVAARPEARSTASEYISTVCADYGTAYGPLVESYLSQFQGGFSTADILQLPAMYNGSRLDPHAPTSCQPCCTALAELCPSAFQSWFRCSTTDSCRHLPQLTALGIH